MNVTLNLFGSNSPPPAARFFIYWAMEADRIKTALHQFHDGYKAPVFSRCLAPRFPGALLPDLTYKKQLSADYTDFRRLNKEFPVWCAHLLGGAVITDNCMKICVNLRNLRIELFLG